MWQCHFEPCCNFQRCLSCAPVSRRYLNMLHQDPQQHTHGQIPLCLSLPYRQEICRRNSRRRSRLCLSGRSWSRTLSVVLQVSIVLFICIITALPACADHMRHMKLSCVTALCVSTSLHATPCKVVDRRASAGGLIGISYKEPVGGRIH